MITIDSTGLQLKLDSIEQKLDALRTTQLQDSTRIYTVYNNIGGIAGVNQNVLAVKTLVQAIQTALTDAVSAGDDGHVEIMGELATILTAIENIELVCQPGEEPEEPAPTGDLPLVGVNFAGLGNNPWCQPGQVGTHYRSILDDNAVDYVQMHAGHLTNGEPWLARIPYALERLFPTLDPNVVSQTYVNQIKAVIAACNAKNGKVILDAHNYCRWYLQHTPELEAAGHPVRDATVNGVYFKTCWVPIGHVDNPVDYVVLAQMYVKIAQLFKDEPGFFAYGLMNEPHGSTVEQTWFAYVQQLINAVRTEDTTAWITVAGGGYSTSKNWRQVSDVLKSLTDPSDKLLFEGHQYPDNNGFGGGSWGGVHATAPIDPVARVADWHDWILWLQENNLRGLAGEFGGPASVQGMPEYFEGLYDLFETHRIPATQWLAGPGDSDNYANGMDTKVSGLKANATENHARIGRTVASYGPRP